MKAGDKGIPGAPSRGDEFSLSFPDTVILFGNEQIPFRWVNGANTDLVNISLVSEKKNILLDMDVNGSLFWFNNITTYFAVSKTLHLFLYEKRTDGMKSQKGHIVFLKSPLKKEEIKKELEAEFKVFEDPRLNMIARATKWEINHYYFEAQDIYKILLLDYPNDEMVKTSYERFRVRSGLD